MKRCPRCTRDLPLDAYTLRPGGRPRGHCRECNSSSAVLVHRVDPLNLALRALPGFRSPLLGIAELCNG